MHGTYLPAFLSRAVRRFSVICEGSTLLPRWLEDVGVRFFAPDRGAPGVLWDLVPG